jgi:hypothetical protein
VTKLLYLYKRTSSVMVSLQYSATKTQEPTSAFVSWHFNPNTLEVQPLGHHGHYLKH